MLNQQHGVQKPGALGVEVGGCVREEEERHSKELTYYNVKGRSKVRESRQIILCGVSKARSLSRQGWDVPRRNVATWDNLAFEKVWTLVDLPYGKKAIGTKWVYRNKKDERGIVVRNKARLVAQGYKQEEGIDYDEVFAPVTRIEAIRLFLAYASFMNSVVYQMDVKSAFLYSTIEEETLSTYLLDNGFYRGQIDKTLFIKRVKDDILLVQVNVDDIIFGSTKKFLFTDFEQIMHKKFQTSSMGELTFFLGLQVKQIEDGIFISQDKSMIGSLMYLTSSRPDIMFSVCACLVCHLNAVKRICRYIKGRPNLGLWYPKDAPFILEAFLDSDYAGASLDKKSTTEGCQFLGSRLISWQCKKQTVVANSTTEAEYIATSQCCADLLTKAFDVSRFNFVSVFDCKHWVKLCTAGTNVSTVKAQLVLKGVVL
ncbi:putative ribonuclease H-like domain-containing protein [Tanacetum coccineum]